MGKGKSHDGTPYAGKLSSLLAALTVIVVGAAAYGDGTGPIAQWSFEDAENLGADSVGSYPFSPVAGDAGSTAPSQVADGHAGNALRITRTGSVTGYAMLGPTDHILPSGSSPFTVSLWIRPDIGSHSSAYIINRMKLDGGSPNNWSVTGSRWTGWYLRFLNSNHLHVYFNGWNSTQANSSNGAVATIPVGQYHDGKWHHAAFTLDSGKTVKIYWDGMKVGEHTITTCNVGNDTRLLIGSYEKSNGYSGDYDEIKFYDYALSEAEIATEAADSTFGLDYTDNYSGILSGSGTVRFSGLGTNVLSNAGISAFTGTYQLYCANVFFGTAADPRAISPNVSLDVANGGSLNFHADTTVKKLSGEGLMGAVNMPEGDTLTVNGSEDSSFAGLVSGNLVKSGSGTLTLAGASVTGNVAVTGGTLVLDRSGPFFRPNLFSIWKFEDADKLGKDSADKGMDFDVRIGNADAPMPTLVADGVSGKALRISRSTSAVGNALVCGTGLPSGTTPFTISAWIRPNANCHANAYIMVRMSLGNGVPGNWGEASWNDCWFVRFSNSGASLAFHFKSWAGATANDDYTVCGTLPSGEYHDGKWHHVVATCDASKMARIYWDGVKLGEHQLTYTTIGSNTKFLLGSYESGNGYNGDYDEIQYLDTVWTDEQVAAEYAARVPSEVQPQDSLPEPVAHWTFDEIEDVGGVKLFRDAGPNGWDFENVPSGSDYVECVTGDGINGGAAYVRTKGTYLQLADGVDPTATFGAKQMDFTFSARFKNVSYTSESRFPFICLGNAHAAETCLRYSLEGWPQMLRILPGSANSREGYDITDTFVSAGPDSPWTTVTCVEDKSKHKMKVYRDGTLVQTLSTSGGYSGSTFNFDLSRIDVGYNTYNKYNGFMVDDMRLYAGCLGEGQIRALVREQSGMRLASPLEQARVNVLPGAELSVTAGTHAAAAVTGAGTVTIGGQAMFGAYDWNVFTGSISGDGTLLVNARVPSAVSISPSTHVLVGGTIATDLAGANLPLITGVGAVKVADAGVVQITNAPTAYSTASKTFVLARGSSVTAPADWSGWSVSPSDPDVPYEFSAAGGAFKLTVKGGIVIIFR